MMWLDAVWQVVFVLSAFAGGAFIVCVGGYLLFLLGAVAFLGSLDVLDWIHDGGLWRLALRVAFGAGLVLGGCVRAWRALVRWLGNGEAGLLLLLVVAGSGCAMIFVGTLVLALADRL